MTLDLELNLSTELVDPKWDEFVINAPGGHYAQSTKWAQVKTTLVWKSIRLTLSVQNQILAGVQILFRKSPIPFTGALGYISQGPLFKDEQPDDFIKNSLLKEIKRICRSKSIQYLAIQPPNNKTGIIDNLLAAGFKNTLKENILTPCTLMIDLTEDWETILSRMKSKTRYNFRLSQKRGIRIYQGNTKDLYIFHQLLKSTAQRRGFIPDREDYVNHVWETFSEKQWIKYFIAEYEGEPVSARIVFAFKDTVYAWRSTWNGKHPTKFPNYALYWAILEWAKSNGYKYFDFGGIDSQEAEALKAGNPSKDYENSLTYFKYGFGGALTFNPTTYEYLPNPLFSWLYNKIYPKIAYSNIVHYIYGLLSRR
jgi:peptidoglycan pentaglycine glycine transferase (the first glycine)